MHPDASIAERSMPAATGEDIWFQPGFSKRLSADELPLIVYVADATLLSDNPVFHAFALIVFVEEIVIGEVYVAEEVVGIVPSRV